MPAQASAPYPTVMLCGGLDSLQSDHYRLFHDYLAPRGIAMLTLDMPSVGYSSKWTLNQDTSHLHQQVLRELSNVPWIDHTRVALFGYRFGANIATRLAWLEVPRIRAVATLGAMVHGVFVDAARQQQLPDMYMDMLASRLGMASTSDSNLRIELNRADAGRLLAGRSFQPGGGLTPDCRFVGAGQNAGYPGFTGISQF